MSRPDMNLRPQTALLIVLFIALAPVAGHRFTSQAASPTEISINASVPAAAPTPMWFAAGGHPKAKRWG